MTAQSMRREAAFYGRDYERYIQNRSEMRIYRNRKRRVQQLRRKLFLILTAILLGCMIALIGNAISSRAKDSSEPVIYKYYQSYEIAPGDTLTSIAREYAADGRCSLSSYMKEVKQINHLHNENLLRAGDYLIIPYYSNEFLQ